MANMRRAALIVLATLATLAPGTPSQSASSDDAAHRVLHYQAKFYPEGAAELGLEQFDTEIMDLGPDVHERYMAAGEAVLAELRAQRDAASDLELRWDLEILIDSLEKDLQSERLHRKHFVPYTNVARATYTGLRSLLSPDNPPERQRRGLERLRRYTGLEGDTPPLVEQARRRTEERLDVEGLLTPYAPELDQDLDSSATYLAGIETLLRDSPIEESEWEPPLQVLRSQVEDYDGWLRKTVRPRAREEAQLPADVYEHRLRQTGVDIAPDQLAQRATAAFAAIRDDMRSLAPRVAAERGWSDTDPVAVLRRLKQKPIANEDLIPAYRARLAEIEEIIRRERIVSLPEREARIRLATKAESARTPAPHLDPPRLLGNQGESSTFVLPVENAHAKGLVFDDFNNDAVSWTLTAHEARPGHELQYAALLENGVSIARAHFAFNSANVEGWALYAETLVRPHLPLEGQLFALQHQLMRAARAFLDPWVNQGRISREEARRVLVDEVGLSEAMAAQEVDRYSFRMPGQATSYFYGLSRLQDLRVRTELALGDDFDQRAFHDFILSQGLLPPDQLAEAVERRFIASAGDPD